MREGETVLASEIIHDLKCRNRTLFGALVAVTLVALGLSVHVIYVAKNRRR